MSTFVKGDSGNWVLIDSNADFTDYYLQDSIKRENHTIKVWVKRVHNQVKGKFDLSKLRIFGNSNLDIINYSLLLYSFDYIEYKYCIERLLHYNDDSNLLCSVNMSPECKEIKPNSEVEFILNQIINKL
jgi:hypothetical protein